MSIHYFEKIKIKLKKWCLTYIICKVNRKGMIGIEHLLRWEKKLVASNNVIAVIILHFNWHNRFSNLSCNMLKENYQMFKIL